MTKKNLILIIARGGGKNISRQNLRLIDEKPLLYYILRTCLKSKIGDVYVSTDSEEIKQVSLFYGVKVIPRPFNLTKKSTSLDEIAAHALSYLKKSNLTYEKCLMTSPVFPLLKVPTISKFLSSLNNTINTVWGVVKEKNEHYQKFHNNNKSVNPLSKQQKKIVKLRKVIAFNCNSFLKHKKFKKPFYGLKIPSDEGVTISNYHDLDVIEKIIKRKKILVRVDGNREIGLGHVYNILTVLNHFRNDEILIVMNSKKRLGSDKFKEQLYNVTYFSKEIRLNEIIRKFNPDIIFNDILDTKKNYVQNLKKFGCFIVNFEDKGSGSNLAHLLFNPIFNLNDNTSKKIFGCKYACIRDEFRIWKHNPGKKSIKILITFGGTDQKNITTKILTSIYRNNLHDLNIQVLLGMGFSHNNQIRKLINLMTRNGFNIHIIEKSDLMAKFVSESNFVITSNGRTVFEVASLKVPMITISSNSREDKHIFSRHSGGGIHLGHYSKLTEKKIKNAINKMTDYKKSQKYVKNLEKFDLLNGVNEAVRLINSEYEKWNRN